MCGWKNPESDTTDSFDKIYLALHKLRFYSDLMHFLHRIFEQKNTLAFFQTGLRRVTISSETNEEEQQEDINKRKVIIDADQKTVFVRLQTLMKSDVFVSSDEIHHF